MSHAACAHAAVRRPVPACAIATPVPSDSPLTPSCPLLRITEHHWAPDQATLLHHLPAWLTRFTARSGGTALASVCVIVSGDVEVVPLLDALSLAEAPSSPACASGADADACAAGVDADAAVTADTAGGLLRAVGGDVLWCSGWGCGSDVLYSLA